jgi:uncharacterized protein (DUF1778 family)
MLAFETDEAVCGATKSVRMEQRTTQEAKELIERAARMMGVHASEFTLVAAAKAARQTVKDYSLTVLSSGDHQAFMNAFETEKPSDELVALMKRHRGAASKK